MKLRIYAFATVNSLQHPVMGVVVSGMHSRFGDERLRLGAFKVMTDGSSSGPTAATREPYTSNGEDRGMLYWDQQGLDDLLQNYGRARADMMFPVQSLIAAGVPVAGSSDVAVTHYTPLFGIEQALTRKTMAGDVCGPDECVDLSTAIRMHTINGAFGSFEEGFNGSLEVGKAADLVVLAEDLGRVPVERRVCLHFVGYTEIWITSPRLAQNAWKVPLSLAIRTAKTLRKPGDFQRMPARLNRLWMTCLHAPSTAPDPTTSPPRQGSWYLMRVRLRST